MESDYRKNPYHLVYGGAITENVKGKINIQAVDYVQLQTGIKVVANVYTPADYNPERKYPAIVAAYPNSQTNSTVSSLLDLMEFDVNTNMELLSQPLLMIAGDKADSLYMTEEVYKSAAASENKELYLVKGATHIQTYWKPEFVRKISMKLTEFFNGKI